MTSPTRSGNSQEGSENDHPIESTPLLAESPVTTGTDSDAAEATTSKDNDKPLPKVQVMLLCYARVVEPIAFFSIFPYINQMLQDNGELAEEDVGFYSGLIESLFSLTQMLVMLFWGRLADRVGRKPVLVSSLVGVSLATGMFGLAHTVWQMALFRCVAGVFSGTIVTIRTMIAEHSTPRTQARSFSWFAFSGNLGIFVGPLIGGALADPAGQYPGAFGGVRFFQEYPYALSSIVVGCIGLTAVLTSALFVEETLPEGLKRGRNKKRRGENGGANGGQNGDAEPGAEAEAAKPCSYTTRELLKAPGVGAVLYNWGHVMLLAYAYTAVVPVFWFTRPDLGGLGFTPLQISLFMGLTGLSQAIWLLLVFPPLQHRIGTNGVMRACGNAYPFFMGMMPLFNIVLLIDMPASRTVFWIFVVVGLSLGPGVSMAFTAAQLAVNDVSPSPESLSTLNALALTGVSALRSFSPASFTSLFAVGVRLHILGGHLVWVILVVLALGFTVSTRYMPPTSEKPPDAGQTTDEDA